MKKSKIILIAVILVSAILGIISWFYIGIYGSPWKIYQAKNITNKYMETKYSDMRYNIDKTGYNFKFGYYFCTVTVESNFPVTFMIKVKAKNNVEDNYYEEKVNTEAKNIVNSLIKDKIPNIDLVTVRTDALDGNYNKFSTFIPQKSDPLLIDITYKGENLSLEDFTDKVLSILDVLKSKNIPLCGLYIKDKGNGYVFNLKGREIDWKHKFTEEEIIKNKFAYKVNIK